MHLEHLIDPDGNETVALHGPDLEEARALQRVFATLAASDKASTRIHGLPYIESIDDCRLTAMTAREEKGIVAQQRPHAFKWVLRRESWDQVAARLDSLCESGEGQQCLADGADLKILFATARP